jgi:hydrogenase expression/formation protein HypC
MCLAVPMRIVSRKDIDAVAEMEGVRRNISLMLLPEAEVNEYVIVHAGFAIERLNEEEAVERIALIRQISSLED